ncbi:MAG: hypothetical protein Q9163_001309 [Psora crenata]
MDIRLILLMLTTLTSFSIEALFLLPSSISDAKSLLHPRGWRRKKRAEGKVVEVWGVYPKYFHEVDGDEAAHHYDSRYSHGTLSYHDKQDTQVHMVRSWLEFLQKNGMESWLAHGTLLGWWWNARTLPWDWDIDVQVSIATLLYLAEHYNSTIYEYTSATEQVGVDALTKKEKALARQYHLDVNPAIYTRARGDGGNIIDARWIDRRNGLYIDITGVAETYPQDSPGMWTCKNYHRYKTRDLWPMRETIYEGVRAKVPYAYERILGQEYGEKALIMEEYQGHMWSAADHVWVKQTPEELKQNHRHNKQATRRRKKQEEKAEVERLQKENAKGKLFDKDEELRKKAQKAVKDTAPAGRSGPEQEELDKEPTKG